MNADEQAKALSDRFNEIGLKQKDMSDLEWKLFFRGEKSICVSWVKAGDCPSDGSVAPKEIRVKQVRLVGK